MRTINCDSIEKYVMWFICTWVLGSLESCCMLRRTLFGPTFTSGMIHLKWQITSVYVYYDCFYFESHHLKVTILHFYHMGVRWEKRPATYILSTCSFWVPENSASSLWATLSHDCGKVTLWRLSHVLALYSFTEGCRKWEEVQNFLFL